jgi:hypothetical protein
MDPSEFSEAVRKSEAVTLRDPLGLVSDGFAGGVVRIGCLDLQKANGIFRLGGFAKQVGKVRPLVDGLAVAGFQTSHGTLTAIALQTGNERSISPRVT